MTSISDTNINVETQNFANMGYINHLKNISSNIQTQRSGMKKQGTAAFSSYQLQDVWTSNETLGKVLDIQNIQGNSTMSNLGARMCKRT